MNTEVLLELLDSDAIYVNDMLNLSCMDGSEITVTGATGLIGLNVIYALCIVQVRVQVPEVDQIRVDVPE